MKSIAYLLLLILGFCSFHSSTPLLDNGRHKIVRSNWPDGYMGSMSSIHMLDAIPCIWEDSNGEIRIKLSFILNKQSYEGDFPDIYLNAIIGEEGKNRFIGLEELESRYTILGTEYYTTIHAKTNHIDAKTFHYKWEIFTLENEVYVPYPINDYPHLFVYEKEKGVNPLVVEGWKRFCQELEDDIFSTTYVGTEAESIEILNESKPQLYQNAHNYQLGKPLNAKVYPNPFTDHLHLTTEVKGSIIVEIFDINKRLVFKEIFRAEKRNLNTIIHTNFLHKGVYYCSIRTIGNMEVVKIVK